MPGRIQALTSFVAVKSDQASFSQMIIYPSHVGTRGAKRRYDLLAAT
ncbi:hypothetical protein COO91_05517 [Nostoc flagelliforme CCNUN1]|uniref:Uncharacterized protein n=1 Tax=Nostoc flagelliforme CCNUN1 TaxID=2038116 RepID=A0A2K8SW08_9NOSO|nr:hypothetical protein COO91_05517 [Nostoc flagelliforme CCNUN1]